MNINGIPDESGRLRQNLLLRFDKSNPNSLALQYWRFWWFFSWIIPHQMNYYPLPFFSFSWTHLVSERRIRFGTKRKVYNQQSSVSAINLYHTKLSLNIFLIKNCFKTLKNNLHSSEFENRKSVSSINWKLNSEFMISMYSLVSVEVERGIDIIDDSFFVGVLNDFMKIQFATNQAIRF